MTRGWKPRHMFAMFVVMVLIVGIGSNPTRRYEMQIGGGYGDTGIDFEADGDILTDGDITTAGDLAVNGDAISSDGALELDSAASSAMYFDAGAMFRFRDTDGGNATRFSVDSSNGDTTIYGDVTMSGTAIVGDDTTPTNGTTFAADGFMTMAGTARVAKYVPFDAGALGLGPSNNPQLLTVSNFLVYAFDKAGDEELWVVFETPGDWASGTDMKVHFHWAPKDGDAGDVTWGISWNAVAAESNEVISAAVTTDIIVDATQSLQDEHLKSGDITMANAGIAAGDAISIRFFRDADASEGGASDSFDDDAYLLKVEVEYMAATLGEDEQW